MTLNKYLPSRILIALRLAQVAAMFGIFAYAVEQLAFNGLYARGWLEIHWLYIAMFLAVLIAYFLFDGINFIYVAPIAIVYYCVHEALFNAFFIPYNDLRNPCCAPIMWYHEMDVIAIVTPIFIAICLKYRKRILRSGEWKTFAICLWAGLIVLYAFRMAEGFPVTINVYGGSSPAALANEFEFATNVLFALTFYSTFNFGRKMFEKMSKPKPDTSKLTISR